MLPRLPPNVAAHAAALETARTMQRPRIAGLSAIGSLLIITAACSGGTSSTATPTPTPTATPAATPAASSVLPSGLPIPSFDLNGDPALAATLPGSVGGYTLQKFSMRGDVFMGSGTVSDPSFQKFLDSVGAKLSDVSVAVGSATAGTDVFTIVAFRVAGATASALQQEFLGAIASSGQVSGWTTQTVGGKSVSVASNTGTEGGSLYAYVTGDTLYYIVTTNTSLAEQGLSQLP
jgi:hypothetical protein